MCLVFLGLVYILLFGRRELLLPLLRSSFMTKKVNKTATVSPFPPPATYRPPFLHTACSSGCLNTQVANSPTAREQLGNREVVSWLLEPAQDMESRGKKKKKKSLQIHQNN